MKKVLAILLVLIMVLTSVCTVFADEPGVNSGGVAYKDVPSDYWAAEAIYSLTEQGIIAGLPDGTFLPEKKLQRGDFSKILAAVAEAPLKAPQNNTFEDVTQENSLYKYIETMSFCFNAYTNRFGDKPLYKPNNFVKREDVAYALVKLYNLDKDDNGEEIDIDTGILNDMFKDSKAVSKNMKRFVTIAVQDGLMSGDNGAFNPQGVLTKADACAIIYNAINNFSMDSVSETLTINPKYVDPLAVGDVVKLKAIMSGSNGKKDVSDEVKWESLSPDIVSVSSYGKITAISKGEAKVTAEINGQEASLTVKVNIGAASSIKISPEKANIKFGDSYQLRATVTYPDGTSVDGNNSTDKLIWKSSDEKVAVVDSKGRVKGISDGKADISVYFSDFPTVSGMCEVTVGNEDLKSADSETDDLNVIDTTKTQNANFDVSSIKAIKDNDNLKLTIDCTSNMARSYFIFDPPQGSIISITGKDAIKKGNNRLIVSIPIDQIKKVQELTMNFIAEGYDEFNFVYLNTNQFASILSATDTVAKNIEFTKDFSYTYGEKTVDKTDYSFVEDPDLMGNWQCVDLVKSPDVFNPDAINSNGVSLFFNTVNFDSLGKTSIVGSIWTKGYIIDKNLQTASKYVIKGINGQTYLFMQWKSGDYIYRHMQPNYYVFKKMS